MKRRFKRIRAESACIVWAPVSKQKASGQQERRKAGARARFRSPSMLRSHDVRSFSTWRRCAANVDASRNIASLRALDVARKFFSSERPHFCLTCVVAFSSAFFLVWIGCRHGGRSARQEASVRGGSVSEQRQCNRVADHVWWPASSGGGSAVPAAGAAAALQQQQQRRRQQQQQPCSLSSACQAAHRRCFSSEPGFTMLPNRHNDKARSALSQRVARRRELLGERQSTRKPRVGAGLSVLHPSPLPASLPSCSRPWGPESPRGQINKLTVSATTRHPWEPIFVSAAGRERDSCRERGLLLSWLATCPRAV